MKKFNFSWVENKNVIIKYLLLMLAMIFLCRTKILGNSFSFGASFGFALIYCKINTLFVVFCYFFAYFLQNMSFFALIIASSVSAILLIFGMICHAGGKDKLILMLIFCAFSHVAKMYFGFNNLAEIGWNVADIAVSTAMCYAFAKIYLALSSRGILMLSSKEKYYLYFCVISIFVGICGINIYNFNLRKAIFAFFVLLSSAVIKRKTVLVGALISVATILFGGSVSQIAEYFVYACLALWLTPHSRLLAGSAVCLADSLLALFSGSAVINLLPTLVATICFVALPKKWLNTASSYFCGAKSGSLIGYYWTEKQILLRQKLNNMSALFAQMQKNYRNLGLANAKSADASNLLAEEIKTKLCVDCPNCLECYNGKNMLPCFAQLFDRALSRGKTNILDVSNLLATYCTRLNTVIASVNALAQEYSTSAKKNVENSANNLNLSMQFGGTSKIFKEFSAEFDSNDKFNTRRATKIKDLLVCEGIMCRECVVIEGKAGLKQIILLVRNIDAVSPKLTIVCEKLYPISFERQECFQTKIAGWSVVSLVPKSRYELLCGYARQAKTVGDKSGDNYIFTRLNDDKFLVAISDGMGHSESANNISAMAVELIECYYKSGLSSQIVLDSVNNLLLPYGEDNFATLDACIVDTFSGQADFIKIGSTISVIKTADTYKIVNVESLPLGAVESAKPSTISYVLSSGDVVVLVSDGIVDVFSSETEFANFVNNLAVINMQLFAENLLEEALARVSDKKDDMTVIAFRLVNKR